MSNPSRSVVIAESALAILVPAAAAAQSRALRLAFESLIAKWRAVIAAEGVPA